MTITAFLHQSRRAKNRWGGRLLKSLLDTWRGVVRELQLERLRLRDEFLREREIQRRHARATRRQLQMRWDTWRLGVARSTKMHSLFTHRKRCLQVNNARARNRKGGQQAGLVDDF